MPSAPRSVACVTRPARPNGAQPNRSKQGASWVISAGLTGVTANHTLDSCGWAALNASSSSHSHRRQRIWSEVAKKRVNRLWTCSHIYSNEIKNQTKYTSLEKTKNIVTNIKNLANGQIIKEQSDILDWLIDHLKLQSGAMKLLDQFI